MVTADLNDDCDMGRERRALAVRGNMLARRFAHSTCDVKVALFKAYCQSLYTGGLWVSYTQKTFSALRVLYNNMFRVLLGLPRFCSASGMFADAHVDGFHALIRKKITSIKTRMHGSPNSILRVLAGRWDSALARHWIAALVNPNAEQIYFVN